MRKGGWKGDRGGCGRVCDGVLVVIATPWSFTLASSLSLRFSLLAPRSLSTPTLPGRLEHRMDQMTGLMGQLVERLGRGADATPGAGNEDSVLNFYGEMRG